MSQLGALTPRPNKFANIANLHEMTKTLVTNAQSSLKLSNTDINPTSTNTTMNNHNHGIPKKTSHSNLSPTLTIGDFGDKNGSLTSLFRQKLMPIFLFKDVQVNSIIGELNVPIVSVKTATCCKGNGSRNVVAKDLIDNLRNGSPGQCLSSSMKKELSDPILLVENIEPCDQHKPMVDMLPKAMPVFFHHLTTSAAHTPSTVLNDVVTLYIHDDPTYAYGNLNVERDGNQLTWTFNSTRIPSSLLERELHAHALSLLRVTTKAIFIMNADVSLSPIFAKTSFGWQRIVMDAFSILHFPTICVTTVPMFSNCNHIDDWKVSYAPISNDMSTDELINMLRPFMNWAIDWVEQMNNEEHKLAQQQSNASSPTPITTDAQNATDVDLNKAVVQSLISYELKQQEEQDIAAATMLSLETAPQPVDKSVLHIHIDSRDGAQDQCQLCIDKGFVPSSSNDKNKHLQKTDNVMSVSNTDQTPVIIDEKEKNVAQHANITTNDEMLYQQLFIRYTNLEDKHNVLESKFSEMSEKFDRLLIRHDALQSDNQRLQNTNAELCKRVDTLEEQLYTSTSLNDELRNVLVGKDEIITQANVRIADLESQIEVLKQDQNMITTLQEHVSLHQQDIVKLRTQLTTELERNQILTADKSQVDKELTDLKKHIHDVDDLKRELTTKLSLMEVQRTSNTHTPTDTNANRHNTIPSNILDVQPNLKVSTSIQYILNQTLMAHKIRYELFQRLVRMGVQFPDLLKTATQVAFMIDADLVTLTQELDAKEEESVLE